MALGKTIRELRKARGLSQEQLSELTGGIVSQGAISNLEKRDSSSSSFTKLLADALNVDVELLLLPEFHPASLSTPPPDSQKEEKKLKSRPSFKYDNSVLIPEYGTGGAMGMGLLLPDQPGQIREWIVTPEWVDKNLPTNTGKQNLCIVTGFGDSMKGMFNSGDPLIVDSGVKAVLFDGIYFFRVGEEGFIKRLQRIPGQGILVISQNPEYRDWYITEDMDFEVFGRVLKVWEGKNF